MAVQKSQVLEESENPKNLNPTSNALSIQTAIIRPNSLIQKSLFSSWDVSYSGQPYEKERLENPGSRAMISDPPTALLFDMVFCASTIGMTVEVQAPVGIILGWRVISNEQYDIKTVHLEIRQGHSCRRWQMNLRMIKISTRIIFSDERGRGKHRKIASFYIFDFLWRSFNWLRKPNGNGS